MRVNQRFLCWTAALLGALLTLTPCPASAQRREQQLKKFVSNIVIAPDGDVDVTENITFRFIGGPWHGIYRKIPIEYAGPNGMNFTLFLDVKRVSDENGPLRYESSRERQYRKLKIFIPNSDNSTHTISIEYVVSDALRFFDEAGFAPDVRAKILGANARRILNLDTPALVTA